MNLKELANFKLHDAIFFHDQLNPAIFESEKMRPDVRDQLILIAEDFVDHLGINGLDITDVTISGSNAAYTYTMHSDIDLHILVDMDKLSDDLIYRELFDAKKTIYNDTHDITIGGYEVELYVQDTNDPVVSLGEYSVLHDKWIRLPKKHRANLDQNSARLKFDKLYHLAQLALKHNDIDKIKSVIKTIKKYRQTGLDMHGEFGPENLAFKALRTKGIIKKLYDRLNDLHSHHLSLPEGQQILDKPTPTILELMQKFGVSKQHILRQLQQGISVESEHTSDLKAAKEIALDHLGEDPFYYTKLAKANLEEASGYIPSNKQKKDWRWKTALTVDITPNSIKDNATKLGSKVSRAGIPPLLRP